MKTSRTEVWIDGLCFPEGLRWHADRLWFSDFFDRIVLSVGRDRDLREEAAVAGQPSGLGWTTDGRLLAVSKLDRRVLRREADGSLSQHADLSGLGEGDCNDMVVDSRGNAYVGELGFDPFDWFANGGSFEDAPTAKLFRIDSNGDAKEVASGLRVPNGAAFLKDERVLVVAESFASQLTAFDVHPETGELSGRRVWAMLPGRTPDGICVDQAGGSIWVADARHRECIRVEEGGLIAETVGTTQKCFACVVGDDRSALYCATAPATDEARASAVRSGLIERVQIGA